MPVKKKGKLRVLVGYRCTYYGCPATTRSKVGWPKGNVHEPYQAPVYETIDPGPDEGPLTVKVQTNRGEQLVTEDAAAKIKAIIEKRYSKWAYDPLPAIDHATVSWTPSKWVEEEEEFNPMKVRN